VYIGAVAVLFLFVVMMLDLRHDSVRDWGFVALGCFIFASIVYGLTIYFLDDLELFYFSPTWSFDVSWAGKLNHGSNIVLLGQVIYTHYAVPFIISGFILLLAMVGSISLTLHHDLSAKRQDLFVQLTRSSTVFLH
jgi:NADH-quinone oxidoreductase subunit J